MTTPYVWADKVPRLTLAQPDDADAQVAFDAIIARARRGEINWTHAFDAFRAYCRLRWPLSVEIRIATTEPDSGFTKTAILRRDG